MEPGQHQVNIPEMTQSIIRRLEAHRRDLQRIEDRAESLRSHATKLEMDTSANKIKSAKLEKDMLALKNEAQAQMTAITKLQDGLAQLQNDVLSLIGAHIDPHPDKPHKDDETTRAGTVVTKK